MKWKVATMRKRKFYRYKVFTPYSLLDEKLKFNKTTTFCLLRKN